ncbi:M12 family metallo-peptidase [Marinicella gelatinilytica]|uniref:M12 family metallo-peptidase n=1 Tax=Marinicella gelatinilytica TaxID=2996017 RepID=UPI00226090DD|nr:M12 family metallo-peptidase [Marinicella gelatinilytica]MCX7544437.1 M12 family metallo-peptidase [Marinicella gelatinilytica]
MRLLFLLLVLLSLNGQLWAKEMPEAYTDFHHDDVIPLSLNPLKSGQLSFTVQGQTIQLPKNLTKSGNHTHSFHQSFSNGELNATWGGGGLFGQLRLANNNYIITTEGHGMWAVKMPDNASYNSCGVQHNQVFEHDLNLKTINRNNHKKAAGTVIDLLVVYDQAIADRYPGELLNARVQQYIHVANQSYANSQLDLSLRLVGLKQTGYNANNANATLLDQLRKTLANISRYQGLTEVPGWRAATGADLVIFLRTHDILTRGNCGIAYFPAGNGQQFNTSYGINIMADGASSWSVCTDQLMVHEIGHNLGAGHHNAALQNRYLPDAAGFAKPGQYGTIMGSFGTGDPNRFLELNYFSSPYVQCGGDACGVPGQRDNVHVMSLLKGPVSQYFQSQSNAPYPDALTPSKTDSDGDGIIDQDDEFPFDSGESKDSDGDGVGDNQDVFPHDPTEWADFDGDGAGDNSDPDIDGDDHLNNVDAFPFDPNEYKDSDSDGVGDHQDAFPDDPTESSDTDGDGVGDNADLDSDNDGYPDIDPDKEDILVISVNNNRILRFDAETGRSKGIEVLPDDGQLTFQSDLVYDSHSQRLIYSTASRIKSIPLRNREQEPTTLVYPYAQDKTQLNSGFPTALAYLLNNKLRVAKTRSTNDSQSQHDYMAEFSIPLVGQAKPLGLKYITTEEESILDFYQQQDTLYALGYNQALYRGHISDSQLQNFTPSPAYWLKNSRAFIVTESGQMIHTKSNQLAMTDAGTGQSLGVFARTASLGYRNLTGITQTRDNRIIVADADKNTLLQFNMDDEFMGELVTGYGMDGPHKIIAVPALKDRFYQNQDRVMSPNAGNWFNPASSGRGFNIGIFNKRLQVLWFTYDQAGLPVWYFSAGLLDGFHYQDTLLKATQISDSEVSFEQVGELAVVFSNERQATVQWQLHELSGSEDIQWQQFSYEPEEDNYTGMWTREDAPGWGTAVTTIGEKTVITPFLYDAAGEPRWLSSDVALGTSPLQFNVGFFTSTTLCPGCSGEAAVDLNYIGEMILDFEQQTWQSDISWPTPLSHKWPINDTNMVRISDEPTRPR